MQQFQGISPSRLPNGFDWIASDDLLVLKHGEFEILRIAKQRAGWVVVITFEHIDMDLRQVAVPSPRGGIGWTRRWLVSSQGLIRAACARKRYGVVAEDAAVAGDALAQPKAARSSAVLISAHNFTTRGVGL